MTHERAAGHCIVRAQNCDGKMHGAVHSRKEEGIIARQYDFQKQGGRMTNGLYKAVKNKMSWD